MKRLIFLFFVFSTVACGQVSDPQISTKDAKYSFGDIAEGAIVSHDYVVTNEGGSLLKIDNVRASCGCTAVQPSKRELEPGDSTVISIKFDSQGRRGLQNKHVYVYSNDPKNRELRLSFEANVLPDKSAASYQPTAKMKLDKYQHNFGKVIEGDLLDLTIQIKNMGDAPLEIREVNTSCDCVTYELPKKTLEPNEMVSLSLKYDTKGRAGELSRTVTIFSNDGQLPQQTIILYTNISKK
ncbi:MAG: DUF1573 domain-containing protein [bacterium]